MKQTEDALDVMFIHRRQKRRFSAPLSIIALLLILGLAFLCVISSGEGKTKIYFYSSETNINNFKSLKMEFDRYLSQFGPYDFQPFSARDIFERIFQRQFTRKVLLINRLRLFSGS